MCGQSSAYNTNATLLPTNPLFRGFSSYPNVNKEVSIINISENQENKTIIAESTKDDIQKKDDKAKLVCPKCGKPLAERNGKFGKFLGCTGFPNCKFTKSV